MDSAIKRHIKIWCIANIIAWATCVGLFALRVHYGDNLYYGRPFAFLTEKIVSSVVGIAFLTGVIIYLEIVSQNPFLKVVRDNALAVAIFVGSILYCMAWIWTYS